MSRTDRLPHRLERTVVIAAEPDTVFRFFTDPSRWAAWWGAGSTIDARPGGPLLIRHPNGVEVSGEVVDVAAPERIAFTYGYASGTPMPAGASLVTIRLERAGSGTRLHLVHEFADESARDPHVQGWRYQLSIFGNAVANEVHARAAETVDAWFAAVSEPDAAGRASALARLAAPDVRLRDRFSAIDGIEDLAAHVAAFQRFVPGVRFARTGEVRQCQGSVLAAWVARAQDGAERSSGDTVFELAPNGKVESVTGFWKPAPPS